MSLQSMALNYAQKNGYDSFAADMYRLGELEDRILVREQKLAKLSRSVQQAIQELGPLRLSEIVDVLDSANRDDVVECLDRLERQKIVSPSGRPGLRVWTVLIVDNSLCF